MHAGWAALARRVLKLDKERYPITQTINRALVDRSGRPGVPGPIAVHIVVTSTMTNTVVRDLKNKNINDLYTNDVSPGWAWVADWLGVFIWAGIVAEWLHCSMRAWMAWQRRSANPLSYACDVVWQQPQPMGQALSSPSSTNPWASSAGAGPRQADQH